LGESVSVVLCVLGFPLAVLDFAFWCASIPWSSPVVVRMTHALLGGFFIGLAVCILSAKPHKKIAVEKTQASN
jgi:RsiW-degrading membrane proteinase PrsW (M82 family)